MRLYLDILFFLCLGNAETSKLLSKTQKILSLKDRGWDGMAVN